MTCRRQAVPDTGQGAGMPFNEMWGALAATLGTAIGAWLLDRWLGVRSRVVNWWRSVKARKSGTEAMVASWPTALKFIEEAKTREDAAEAREARLTGEFQAIRGHLSRQDSALEHIAAQLWGALRFDVQAKFQCDTTGRNVQVNAAYASLMRVGEFELMGYGWKNRVLDEDRRDYEQQAGQAFREHRKFERTVRFQRGDGTVFRGRVRLEPHPEDPQDLAEGRDPLWFGSVTLVEEIQ